MFDITTIRNGEVVARAEAEDAEGALRAGQVLFDEAIDLFDVQGARKAITTIFLSNGKHVHTVEGRRPE